MKEFACAALPWVLAGIAVALICAASGGRKDGADKAYDERIAVGAGARAAVRRDAKRLRPVGGSRPRHCHRASLGHGHRRDGRQGPPEGEKIE